MSHISRGMNDVHSRRSPIRRIPSDSMDEGSDSTDAESAYAPHNIDDAMDKSSLPQSVSRSLLFVLPREIRDRIYSYCLSAPDREHLEWPTSYHVRTMPALSPSLLRTSKLITDEATSILYGTNTLSFSHPSDANMFVRALTPKIAASKIARLHLPIKVQEMRMWMPYLTSNDMSRSLKTDYPALRDLTIRYKSNKWQHNASPETNLRHWSEDARLDELINGLSNVYYPRDQHARAQGDESEELPDASTSDSVHDPGTAPDIRRWQDAGNCDQIPPTIKVICACRVHSTQFATLTAGRPFTFHNVNQAPTPQQTAAFNSLAAQVGPTPPAQLPGVASILESLLPSAGPPLATAVKAGTEFRGFTQADFRGRATKATRLGGVGGKYDRESVQTARTVFTTKGQVLLALEVYAADLAAGGHTAHQRQSFDMAAKTHEVPDLAGKVIVITGAETVRKLAAKNPAQIFLCARTMSKAEALITEIKQQHSSVNITPININQGSLKSVRAGADTILAQTTRIDLLYLNAGVAFVTPALTEDGYEEEFGVNHVSHALLTQLLLPTLLKTASAPQSDVRIIALSSDAAKGFLSPSKIELSKVKTKMEDAGGPARYGQSKLANLLFAKKLAQLYPSITSVSIHPGMVSTEIFGKMGAGGLLKVLFKPIVYFASYNVEDGAKTQIWAGTGKEVLTGKYYVPFGKEATFKAAEDEKIMNELWEWTDEELKNKGGSGWPKP
nr:hypothetical protein B0A51_02758 [Rachicladosporium sp. CCFEE 5018]